MELVFKKLFYPSLFTCINDPISLYLYKKHL